MCLISYLLLLVLILVTVLRGNCDIPVPYIHCISSDNVVKILSVESTGDQWPADVPFNISINGLSEEMFVGGNLTLSINMDGQPQPNRVFPMKGVPRGPVQFRLEFPTDPVPPGKYYLDLQLSAVDENGLSLFCVSFILDRSNSHQHQSVVINEGQDPSSASSIQISVVAPSSSTVSSQFNPLVGHRHSHLPPLQGNGQIPPLFSDKSRRSILRKSLP